MLKRLLLDEGIDVLTYVNCRVMRGQEIALEPSFFHDYEVCVWRPVENSAGCFLFRKILPLTNPNITTHANGRFILADFVVYSKECGAIVLRLCAHWHSRT